MSYAGPLGVLAALEEDRRLTTRLLRIVDKREVSLKYIPKLVSVLVQ